MPDPTAKALPIKIKRPTADEVIVLYAKSLRTIHAWYRKQPTHGEELGKNSMLEIVFGHEVMAMDLAQQGKEWKPV